MFTLVYTLIICFCAIQAFR